MSIFDILFVILFLTKIYVGTTIVVLTLKKLEKDVKEHENAQKNRENDSKKDN